MVLGAGRLGAWVLGVILLVGSQTPAAQTTRQPELPPTIPVFPLGDVMLFPRASRPLHIFEPRYRAMVRDALEGDGIIGMVMLKPGHEAEYYGRPPIHELGCAGEIVRAQELPDGRYLILLKGIARFRVESEENDRPYRVARIDVVPEIMPAEGAAKLARMRPFLVDLLDRATAATRESSDDQMSDEELVDVLAQTLSMEPADRLRLLRLEGPLARAERLQLQFRTTASRH